MVAPIASAAGSLGRAFARRGGARKGRASPRRSGSRGHSTCTLSPLGVGAWPTPAELTKTLPNAKRIDDAGERLAGLASAPEHLAITAAGRRAWEAAAAMGVLLPMEVCNNSSGTVSSSTACSGGNPALDFDKQAAAVRAFLERVQHLKDASWEGGCGVNTVPAVHRGRHDLPSAGDAELSEVRLAPTPGKQRVWFNLGQNSVHEIPPYMEIYGRHPREFVFGRCSEMLPAGDRFGFVGLGDSIAEDEDCYAQEEERVDEQEGDMCRLESEGRHVQAGDGQVCDAEKEELEH